MGKRSYWGNACQCTCCYVGKQHTLDEHKANVIQDDRLQDEDDELDAAQAEIGDTYDQ